MLRNFLYLNTVALNGYVGDLEDGLRDGSETEASTTTGVGVGADARVIKGNLDRSTVGVRRTSGKDTPEARFGRLMNIAAADPEPLAWIDVLDPENDLAEVGYGAMISGEAEFYTPRMIQLLTSGDFGRAVDMLEKLEPFADAFGLDKSGLPDNRQLGAARAAVDSFRADVVTVGEFDGSEWKVAAQLSGEYTRAPVEGPALFVGKVTQQWPAGQGRHLLALPGTTLLPRHERRSLQSRKPENPDDDSFLDGPAVMLDLLAIWR
jgi:hypothetical protein